MSVEPHVVANRMRTPDPLRWQLVCPRTRKGTRWVVTTRDVVPAPHSQVEGPLWRRGRRAEVAADSLRK